MGSGCGCLIADFSFVCQTTPHFGSTSRKASYSVRAYITPNFPICKDPIVQFLSNALHPRPPLGGGCHASGVTGGESRQQPASK